MAIPLPEPLGVETSWADAGYREVRVVGNRGEVSRALVRDDRDAGEAAFTLVGEGVVDVVDPATIDGLLDAGTVFC